MSQDSVPMELCDDSDFVVISASSSSESDVHVDITNSNNNNEPDGIPGASLAQPGAHCVNMPHISSMASFKSVATESKEDSIHRIDTVSLGGWSEISNVASIHSIHSFESNTNNISPTRVVSIGGQAQAAVSAHVAAQVVVAEMEGKIMENGINIYNNNYHNSNNSNNNNNNNNQMYESEGQIGIGDNKVPFSWAEITKIQPIFDSVITQNSKLKIDNKMKKKRRRNNKKNNKSKEENSNKRQEMDHECDNDSSMLQSIPEADPASTKIDLGRRKKSVKYPNGKKGSRRNPRKKNTT